MPGKFDPYHTWLAIPPERQPPNHYDLLGVPLFEDNPSTIEHAADQRMTHLRTLQTGKHGGLSQKLLNEVAAARVCLLNVDKKAAYDRRLRKALQTVPRAKPAGRKPSVETTTQSTDFNQLGEYRLLEKLGEGGMGTVYKALHTKLERVVALKVLPKGRIEDQKAIARFEREMIAVGRLDHPNIVRAMDAREVKGTRFLVMEFVDGMDLAELVRRQGPLPVADACELIRHAALGLQCAHEHDLVHRDVKPSNLMLNQQGQVKLLDLGLARFQFGQPGGEEMTAADQALGTLDYMSPEQAADTRAVDIRADIYSLGCTFYKLLSGRAPFDDPRYKTAFEKMTAHVKAPPPAIRKLRGDVPKELVAVLNRMLAKDPARRYRTPAEVADAVGPLAAAADLPGLLAGAQHKPPMARPSKSLVGTQKSLSSSLTRFLERLKIKPPPPPPGTEKGTRTNLPLILCAAAVGLVLLLGVVVWGLFFTGKPPQEAVLVFDWPADVRQEVKLLVDGNRATFPPTAGPIEYRCQPGEHRIAAERPGFKPYEKLLTLKAGDRKQISPKWQRQSYLVLQWPVTERRGAKLEIDGEEHDLSDLTPRPSRIRLSLPLEPGTHQVRITRTGFKPFEQPFDIVDGKDVSIEPVWEELVAQLVVGPPEPDKRLPAPSDDAQQEFAEQIDSFYRIAAAKTAAEKLELAGKLLEVGKGPKENPAERYVLLHRAAEMATEGGDAALMRQAVDAMAAAFEVDAAALKQTALATIAEVEESRRQADAATARAAEAAAQQAEAQRLRQERYTVALKPAEEKVAAWDFRGAAAALAEVRFEDDADLAAQLTRRRDDVQRMAALKAKMIAKIKAADPPLKKSDLMLRGLPGEVTGADDKAIHARLSSGKTEDHPWGELSEKARPKVLELVIDQQSADDWLSAAILAFACGDGDLAERLFAQASRRGADIGPYLAPMAESIFAEANDLLVRREFTKADAALTALEQKYSKTPWFTSHQEAVAATRAAAKTGIHESEAEKLYAEAVELLNKEELFDLRGLVEKLKSEYPKTHPVSDDQRKPSFADMQKRVADVSQWIVVRKDGEGQFKSIQTAIEAAKPKAWIQIQDAEEYDEKVFIPKEKEGLTIQGKKGCWPMITWTGQKREPDSLVAVEARGTTLERLVLVNVDVIGRTPYCLAVRAGQFRLHSTIVFDKRGPKTFALDGFFGPSEIKDCLILANVAVGKMSGNKAVFRNSLLLADKVEVGMPSTLQSCTICSTLSLWGHLGTEILDCTMNKVTIDRDFPDHRIENCAFFGAALPAEAKNSFSANRGSLFVDPSVLNFRLDPKSPDLKKASDPGNLGCRYTPEMIEVCKQALELREKHIIKF